VEPLLRTANLTRCLDGEVPVTLVRDANVEILQNEFVAITGPSGSGKSSLLYLIGLLDLPTHGHIYLRGVDVSTFDEDRLADTRLAEIGFVFQFHFLLPEFSVLENVMIPMQRLGRLPAAAMRTRAEELLSELGLLEHRHKLPKQLSGGQSQRVAIARALANDPGLILADEPTGNLDSASSEKVQTLLNTLARRPNKAVVVVTHDQTFSKRADRIITIVDGMIVPGRG